MRDRERRITGPEMAEVQPPEGQINGEAGGVVASSENVSSKRQRRPSVRLGDIGDQSFDSHSRRSKQWKLPNDNHRYISQKDSVTKASKTRPLVNLGAGGGGGGGGGGEFHETLDSEDKSLGVTGEGNLDTVAIGSWRVKDSKSKRGSTKRVRSNWLSKVDGGVEGEEKFSGAEDVDDACRDFEPEGSESLLKEHSPIHSLDNMAVEPSDRGQGNERDVLFHAQRRGIRGRVSENRDHEHEHEQDAAELDGDARDWKCGTSVDRNGSSGRVRCRSPEDSVRIWLNGLGLGRYAPVFEIHEVDDEVLPMLTLEDLKDMGINAVGSRRKMYCAIQKLGKGFS